MAISDDRMLVSGATAESKSRVDFIETNENDKFNTVLEIPNTIISTDIEDGSILGTAVSKSSDVIYDAIDELNFTNNITSTARAEIALSATDVMNTATNTIGQTIGNKNMIDLLFSDCPYSGDSGNLDYLFGLLLGLLPSLAYRQSCSNGLISMLINAFAGDTTPAMIGKSLMGIVDNVKDGKGTAFLEDLNLNAEVLNMGSTLLNVNTSISGIVKKSDLSTSREPDKAYQTMTANMDFNNTIFDTNDSVTKVASKKNMSRTPVLPVDDNDEPKKVEFSDILSVKIYGNKSTNIFDTGEYI